LAYNFFLVLICGETRELGMKSEARFLRKKQWILRTFEALVRHKIDLEISSIAQLAHIYLKGFRVYVV
jgi:hypothetical protein